MGSAAAPTMLGLALPDVDRWSERVVVALGQNPGVFTGPGTNTYLIGTGPKRILLDTGSGRDGYLPVLERAIAVAGCEGIQEIVLTHGHPDHIGGALDVAARYGPLRISKQPWPEVDAGYDLALTPLADGAEIRTEGATLRAVHAPGHAPDHLCFVLEEERALFTGDNVLGVGTTLIPAESGDLGAYLTSLERLLAESPTRIYPAHGPLVTDGTAKLREYLQHRRERETQVLTILGRGEATVRQLVDEIYAVYPQRLRAAASVQIGQQLAKLEREGRVLRAPADTPRAEHAAAATSHEPTSQKWRLA